jgi:antitoxin ParD1/3/4
VPKRNVVLTDHQATLVEELVSTGRYQNASEVLREGLRLIEAHEAQDNARRYALRQALQVGIADIEAGRFQSFESPADLRNCLSKIASKAIGTRPAARFMSHAIRGRDDTSSCSESDRHRAAM